MVKLKILEQDDESVKFLVEEVNYSFVNALRRTVLSEIETLAVEDIYIYENSSTMFDEYIGHRIGLLPIRATGKISKDDKITLMLDQEGPCTVYAKDIQSTDPNVNIVTPNVPIIKLKQGQRLRLELKAVFGSGKEHVKWQPGTAAYHNVGVVKVDEYCNLCEKCVKSCPKEVLAIKNKKIVMAEPEKCNICGECREICPEKSIDIELKDNDFIFYVESFGQHKPKEMIIKASNKLKEKLEEFKQLSKKKLK